MGPEEKNSHVCYIIQCGKPVAHFKSIADTKELEITLTDENAGPLIMGAVGPLAFEMKVKFPEGVALCLQETIYQAHDELRGYPELRCEIGSPRTRHERPAVLPAVSLPGAGPLCGLLFEMRGGKEWNG